MWGWSTGEGGLLHFTSFKLLMGICNQTLGSCSIAATKNHDRTAGLLYWPYCAGEPIKRADERLFRAPACLCCPFVVCVSPSGRRAERSKSPLRSSWRSRCRPSGPRCGSEAGSWPPPPEPGRPRWDSHAWRWSKRSRLAERVKMRCCDCCGRTSVSHLYCNSRSILINWLEAHCLTKLLRMWGWVELTLSWLSMTPLGWPVVPEV